MYKQIITQRKFISYKDAKEGDVLVEGTLVKTVPNKFGKGVDWLFETDGSDVHTVLNHAGSLAKIFEDNSVDLGDKVKVVYGGSFTLDRGAYKGRPCHDFKVWVDYADEKVRSVVPKDEDDKVDGMKSTAFMNEAEKQQIRNDGLDIADLD